MQIISSSSNKAQFYLETLNSRSISKISGKSFVRNRQNFTNTSFEVENSVSRHNFGFQKRRKKIGIKAFPGEKAITDYIRLTLICDCIGSELNRSK